MGNEVDRPRQRRRHTRAPGPFSGYHLGWPKTPVLIYEMSLSGGFISFTGQQPKEPALDLQIDLPHEDPIIVRAEMVYRHQFGLAVRFVDLAPDTHARLTRVVEASTGKS